MTPSFLRNNLRLQLIAPVAITLVVGLIILVTVILITQSKGNKLLAQVSESAVIARDFSSLNAFVRSTHQNPDMVFTFYLDSKQTPMTRSLEQKKSKTQILPV